MIFRWSTSGYDVQLMSASAKSLYPFFPDATYVAVCNGDEKTFEHMKSVLEPPFTQAFSALDYEWPFVFDAEGKRCFWKKWWPAYIPELGGTQFHIDNDILFIHKPVRFLEDFDVYCLVDCLDPICGNIDFRSTLSIVCGCLSDVFIRDHFTATNTGVVGVTEAANRDFWRGVYSTANKFYEHGLDMYQTAEQACVGYVAQTRSRYNTLRLKLENKLYVTNCYRLLNYDGVPPDSLAGLHFIDRSKRVMDKFVSNFDVSSWDADKLDRLREYLTDPRKFGILWESDWEYDRWTAGIDG